MEFYPFESIAANDRSGSESDLKEDILVRLFADWLTLSGMYMHRSALFTTFP